MNDEDHPITLADACALYQQAKLTISTLRAEAARGRLTVFRIGKRDYTTRAAMCRMVRRCRDEDYRRNSISMRSASNGLSETERVSSALARANETVARLKRISPDTSGRNTSQSRPARP